MRKRVLVAHKRSTYERYLADPELAEKAEAERLRRAHKEHSETMEAVVDALRNADVDADVVPRSDVESVDDYDLVVSVGGDGTVLDLSHKVGTVPILAVNSDPVASVGYFCASDAVTFAETLADVLDGNGVDELCRFQVRINDEAVGFPILNDVLVCHTNPAAVSKYVISFDGVDETQKSSGLWISTAAGSTAAIRSAGGYVMPITSSRVQYLVREPYPPPKLAYRLLKGFIGDKSQFHLESQMPDGRVYLDGPHESVSFTVGDKVSIDRNVEPLRIYGVARKVRI